MSGNVHWKEAVPPFTQKGISGTRYWVDAKGRTINWSSFDAVQAQSHLQQYTTKWACPKCGSLKIKFGAGGTRTCMECGVGKDHHAENGMHKTLDGSTKNHHPNNIFNIPEWDF